MIHFIDKHLIQYAGEEAGSKLDRARELGIAILDETGLFQLLRGESP